VYLSPLNRLTAERSFLDEHFNECDAWLAAGRYLNNKGGEITTFEQTEGRYPNPTSSSNVH
jgi:hypothetical protein